MLDVLYKKAKGYDVEETSREYVVDEDGNKKLQKEKTTTKHIPPDLAALKACMEMKDTELMKMSTEELKNEKLRLLRELRSIEKENKKKNDGKKD
jgi:hypothetical protein